jgi:Ca-activated chloride channel family protein
MDWLWPDSLLLLGVVPASVALYLWVSQRRRFSVRYSSLFLIRDGQPQLSWVRRHLPFLLFTIALTGLVLAQGRPIVPVNVLSGQTTIMLTLDISRSMCIRDIRPTRLDVAKLSALSFVENPVLGTQVGVVAFAGFAELAHAPTTDVEVLAYTIQNLSTATNTAIGSGILRSLDAIAEVDENVPKSVPIDDSAAYPSDPAALLETTSDDYAPHIIVLLTDGASNSGPHPLLAAQQAAERGVRVYTIGFGTTKSAVMDCGTTIADESYLSPGLETPGSGGFGAAPDEATLRQIAKMTGGEFYSATSAAELQFVFQELHEFVAESNQTVEISVLFTALSVLLAVTAFILSLFWHPLL